MNRAITAYGIGELQSRDEFVDTDSSRHRESAHVVGVVYVPR